MPTNNLNETKIGSEKNAQKRTPNKGKSHTGKSVKTKKLRRKNIPDRTKNHKGMH